MKDEIKEILEIRSVEQQAIDNLKAIISCDDKIIEIEPPLEDTAKILLDYITNLQTIEKEYSSLLSENAELENKITNLQEENNRLKHSILEKQFPDLNAVQVQIKTERYRIDKAIEYIKSFEYYIPEDNKENLLNILKGE